MKTFVGVNKKTNLVEEIIIGDNFSAISVLLPELDIYEQTEKTGKAYIDGEFCENNFLMPRPYKSWIFNKNKKSWNPPKDYPKDGNLYEWIEEKQIWSKINYVRN